MVMKLGRITHLKNPLANTLLISSATVISKILGFVREMVMAAYFGTSFWLDAFLIASVIPNMLFAVAGSALTTSVLPLIAEYRTKEGQESVLSFLNSVTTFMLLILLVIAAAGGIFAAEITHLAAPGFKGQVLDTAVSLSRILFPMMIFWGLSGLAAGILQSQKRFFYPAFIGLPYNIIIISMLLIGGEIWGIQGLAVAFLLGAASQWLFQVPDVRRTGYHFKFQVDFSHPGFKKMGVLILPVIIGAGVSQINLLVDRMLASGLAEGSISALHYSSRLNFMVYGVIGIAVARVMYPELAEAAVVQDMSKFIHSLVRSLNALALVIIPAALGIIVLREPLVRLAFQRGTFGETAAFLTIAALFYYALGLPAMSLRELLLRAFWSLQDTMTPMMIGLITLGLNIVLNLILVGYLAHGGLALATSISITINFLLLLLLLRKKVGHLGGGMLLTSCSKIMLAAAAMGIGVYYLQHYFAGVLPGGTSGDLIVLGVCSASGAGVYLGLIKMLRVEEFDWLCGKIRTKLSR